MRVLSISPLLRLLWPHPHTTSLRKGSGFLLLFGPKRLPHMTPMHHKCPIRSPRGARRGLKWVFVSLSSLGCACTCMRVCVCVRPPRNVSPPGCACVTSLSPQGQSVYLLRASPLPSLAETGILLRVWGPLCLLDNPGLSGPLSTATRQLSRVP